MVNSHSLNQSPASKQTPCPNLLPFVTSRHHYKSAERKNDGTSFAIYGLRGDAFSSEATMKRVQERAGKVGYIILWLLGIPIPILLLIFFLRGCN